MGGRTKALDKKAHALRILEKRLKRQGNYVVGNFEKIKEKMVGEAFEHGRRAGYLDGLQDSLEIVQSNSSISKARTAMRKFLDEARG